MSTANNTDDDDFKITRVIGNEILYYGEITNEDILEFIEEFKKLEIKLLKQKAELMGYEPVIRVHICLLYTSPSPRDLSTSRMPSSA